MIELNAMAAPIFSLITGILILVFPSILNYVIALYLIIIGLMGILQ